MTDTYLPPHERALSAQIGYANTILDAIAALMAYCFTTWMPDITKAWNENE